MEVQDAICIYLIMGKTNKRKLATIRALTGAFKRRGYQLVTQR